MKTIKEWFETIQDEEVRERALRNIKYSNEEAINLAAAIGNGFKWSYTSEGHRYWMKIRERILNGETI